MAIAIARPELAVAVVALLTALSLAAAFVLYRVARRLGRNLRSATSNRARRSGPPDPTPV